MKAMVLCSGGVDSTTCLGMAVDKYGAENVIALSIYYGQKHTKEIKWSIYHWIWKKYFSTVIVPCFHIPIKRFRRKAMPAR